MKIIPFILSLMLDVVIKRFTRPQTIFGRLALASLVISGGALVTPFWQQAVESVLAMLRKSSGPVADGPLSPLAAGGFFLFLTFVFAFISHKLSKPQTDPKVDAKLISPSVQTGLSRLFCYRGSVLHLTEAAVVVTSENQYLDLGSIAGTSVSGRVRRLAASFNSDGTVAQDHLQDFLDNWKTANGHAGPFKTGLCVVAPPFNAMRKGIESIIHAAAIQKLDSGQCVIEEAAIHDIIDFAIQHCLAAGHRSLFIPVFGLGSGGVERDEAIAKTLVPLIELLKQTPVNLDVYVGTYRILDAVQVANFLLKN